MLPDRTSFNIQVLACFCFALLTLIRSVRKAANIADEEIPPHWPRVGLICISLLTCLAYGPSLRDPLVSDDFILIHSSAQPAALWKKLTEPAGDGAMRPVGEVLFGTYKIWAREDPVKWHALGLVLHLVNTILLYWLCRRMRLTAYPALLACALFAFHPAHPEAVAWTASTFDLLATVFSLSTLIALTLESRVAVFLAAPVLTVLAILSKESAYAIPVIALLVLGNRRRFAMPCALLATVLFLHRWHVFGGPGGYLDVATGRPQVLNATVFSVVNALVYRPWWPFLAAVDWAVPPPLILRTILGTFYSALGILAWRWRPTRSTHLLLIAAVMAALIPPVHLALIGPDLQGTRVFYLPSVFFCIWLSRVPRNWLLAAILLIFSFAALRQNLSVRTQAALAAERACRAAAVESAGTGDVIVEQFPKSLDGVFISGAGFEECVRMVSRNPEARVFGPATVVRAPILRWDSHSRELGQISRGR